MDKTCPDCGRVFTKVAHLTRHRLTHDQQRPFSCTVCGKSFARPDALQRHVRTVHGKRQRTESEAQSGSPTSPSAIFDLQAADALGSLSFPPLFPLPVFANTSTPITQSLDEMVAGWLSHDGSALATENALAAAFSDQANWEPDLTDTFYTEPQVANREPRRRMMNADTWESGMSNPQHHDVSRPASPPPREITSPEQVVAELRMDNTTPPRDTVIPSMKFLEACLHLYFRDFHPSFPVIHRPTFERDRTPPLLLLSICSIGCMFVGTQAARDSGVWIYERLHHVIVVTRDAKMATEESRVAVMLSALLGQCFSFLYGQPKQMLTAESFHGSLSTKARRSGLAKLQRNPIPNLDVEPAKLNRTWREWAKQETLRRLTLGLTIHAAESTVYSGMARFMVGQIVDTDGFSDALFEANDPETWRAIALGGAARTSEHFLPSALLAQTIVNIHKARELAQTQFGKELSLAEFYDHMLQLASDHDIDALLARPRDVAPDHVRALAALWHYACVVRLAPLTLIQEAAGRGGHPASEIITETKQWLNTPRARLAALHCGHVLHHAADLYDRAFLLPRAIFQATLLLLCYLHFSPQSGEPFNALEVIDWSRFCFALEGEESGSAERFVAEGKRPVQVAGFCDGNEQALDIVILRSRSNRLLRRCTPWGIGETLSDVLSKVWI